MMIIAVSLICIAFAIPDRLSAVIVSRFVNGPFLDALFNARIALPIMYPIYVVTHAENAAQIRSYRGLHVLPLENISMPASYGAYSDLLVSCAFWESLSGEFVLVFQSDSRFCLGEDRPIDFFTGLGYDWIGAPWPVSADWNPLIRLGLLVGNGGLSLRKRSAMLDCCVPRTHRREHIEDFHLLRCLEPHRVASIAHAEMFSAEGYFATNNEKPPFGVHKTYAYITGENRTHLHKLCPESEMLEDWFMT
jgi:hypothetical protein